MKGRVISGIDNASKRVINHVKRSCIEGDTREKLQSLQAMANDSDLNIENNIRKRDTQFINIFWLKTLENEIKCILLCILLEHTGGINVCFGIELV